MKTVTKLLLVFTLAVMLFPTGNLYAQGEENGDRTLSPYFFIRSDDPGTDRLPLKSTSADVNISGVIADVIVTQVYKNEGSRPIEAVYVFPASTKAAVYGMKMTVGERIINAVVKQRDEARHDYEQAKQQGKSASLLEQHRPNVFQMNVANILPGDTIKVELSYTEILVPTDRIYEFIYPTVVGPRYSNQAVSEAPASEKWIENPYLHEGEHPDYTFDIKVNISSGLPLQDVYSTSHRINANFDGAAAASISLDKTEKYGGNRDFILKYRLAGRAVDSGLLMYKGENENFFLLMVQPPERVKPSEIPPREYIFIVDVSGSMHGFPLDISKKLLKDLIGNLRPTDTFNVLLFSGGSSVMAESPVPANASNINRAVSLIERQRGGGGTELLPALKQAFSMRSSGGCSRTFVIVTDGYVSVEEEAFDLIRENLGNANVFPFGIGSSVNRHIIEGMAHAGMGEPFVITKPGEAAAKAGKFREMVRTPVMTDIVIDYDGFDTYDVEPRSIPDVMADRPVVVFGKWRGRSGGKIRLKGISGSGEWTDVIDAGRSDLSPGNASLRYLWARHRIRTLSDYNILRMNDERRDEVTSLGLTYNLLTAYTSFVAVDTEVRNDGGKVTTIRQPLPLPEGVSDYAVAGALVKRAASPHLFTPGITAGMTAAPVKEEEMKKDKVDPGSLHIAKISVSGGLTEQAVKNVLLQSLTGLRGCFMKTGADRGMTFEFIIDRNGKVKSARSTVRRSKNSEAETCVISKIKKLLFPETGDGRDVAVRVVFESGV